MARPTKLTRNLVDKFICTYLDQVNVEEELPCIEGLALYAGVSRSTLYRWRDEIEDKSQDDDIKIQKYQYRFLDEIERILATQAKQLMNNGLNGKYNASITKLMLNQHGIVEKEKVEQDTTIIVETVKQF